ncbi:MAG: hypothetical protein AVDCRST_MAG93-6223, partial [uncultured Chloroflexia bacterium]
MGSTCVWCNLPHAREADAIERMNR